MTRQEGERLRHAPQKGRWGEAHGRAGNIELRGTPLPWGTRTSMRDRNRLDGLRVMWSWNHSPHGLRGEMSRSRGGNADPAVMARPEDTRCSASSFGIRSIAHSPGLGDHCVEIDDMAECIADALGDRRQVNFKCCAPQAMSRRSLYLIAFDHIHGRVSSDPVGKRDGAPASPGSEAHGGKTVCPALRACPPPASSTMPAP